MGTSTIPFSNPAGNNQNSPSSTLKMPGQAGGAGGGSLASGNIPGSPSQGLNPFGLTARAQNTGTAVAPGTNSNTFITPLTSGSGTNNLDKQLVDIYGKGVGGSLFTLLNSMSGTDSKVLQQFIQSLGPQMAQAQANINANLGAGGVSANSSVAAIADSNLQSQENALIAGESSKLIQSQEDLTAQLLMGMSGDAKKEVATSGWTTFADVMNQISGDAGNLLGGSFTTPGNKGQSQSSTVPLSQDGTMSTFDTVGLDNIML